MVFWYMRRYQLLTLLLIFTLPFFPNQFVDARTQQSLPLIAFFILLLCISLLPIFFRAFLHDVKRKFIPTIFFLVFLIPLTIATIFSIDKQQSVLQLLLFFSYFVIFVSIPAVFQSFRSKELFTACYLLLTACLSFISLYNTLIRHYVNRQNLSFLWIYFGHNHLSTLLIFAIPLCLYALSIYWEKSRLRLIFLAIIFILLASLLFTFSIGSMFVLALSFLVIWLMFNKTLPLKKSFLMVFAVLTLFALGSFSFFSIHKGLKTLNLRKDPNHNVSVRLIYWQKAFDNFIQRPLTGTGPDTFSKINITTRPFSWYTHNFFIQMLTDSGIFGFLASILLIGAVLWRGYQIIKTVSTKREQLFYLSIFIGLVSSTLMAMADFEWQLPTAFLFFWIFAGFLRNYAN